MTFKYISVDEAIERPGLRMVVVGGVPSMWSEAAKGIFHVKDVDWAAVRLDYESERLKEWAGQRSGPVAVYEKERPRSGWAEILLLAERLKPEPSLVPAEPAQRALMFGVAHEICGEAGLGWTRRLQMVHAGLNKAGGFPEPVAKYLAKKYGYSPGAATASGARVIQLLGMLAMWLKVQRASGKRYLIGGSLTAADIYCAAAMAMFKPLPEKQCKMDPVTRSVFENVDADTAAALDPALLEHRDMMYAEHLELPLSL